MIIIKTNQYIIIYRNKKSSSKEGSEKKSRKTNIKNNNNNLIMNPSEIIFNYIFPWGGVIIANFMYSAPFKDVRDASMTGDLGNLNPLPWAFMSGNTYGWYVIYLFCYYE